MLDVSTAVVISAYTLERWADLEAALRGLSKQLTPPTEVILVIDNNHELSTRARSIGREILPRIIVEDFQGGLSAARNLGVELSTSEVIAFLDDDAVPSPPWLSELVRPFAEDDSVMMTGGTIRPGWPAAGRPFWFPDEFLWVVGATYAGAHSRGDLRNPLGASMAVRRRAWEVAGGFATSIGLGADSVAGCEETDFAVRLKVAEENCRLIFCADSEVVHRVTVERRTFRYFLYRCRVEGRSKAFFVKRNGSVSLAPERVHAFGTIPRAAVKNCRAAARGDRGALARTGALIVGLLTVVLSFGGEYLRLTLLGQIGSGQ